MRAKGSSIEIEHVTFTYFDINGVRRQCHLKFDAKKVLTRAIVCILFAPAMYWPLCSGHAYKAALVGYLLAVFVYLTIQCLTHFRHPLNGALLVIVLEVIYGWEVALALAMGGMGR